MKDTEFVETTWMVLEWRFVRACVWSLALVLAFAVVSSAQATGFNVNSLVTFTPLTATYRTLGDTVGCPAGFVGKFTFGALLTNNPGGPGIPDVVVHVLTLTNGNILLDPQTNAVLGGVGAVMKVSRMGQYVDGLLSSGEAVEVPFVLCLKTLQSFQFVVDVSGIVTELVSVNRFGANSGENSSAHVAINKDGRFVAFESAASDLVANDTNGQADVFVRDLQAGTTTLVSVNQSGTNSGNDSSEHAVLSVDGRFVVFDSRATDLASDLATSDGNGQLDVFVRDLHAGTTTLVSVNRFGTNAGNNASFAGTTGSFNSVLSVDGRFVAFASDASDLVANDTNGQQDVFVRDLQTGTTTLASLNRSGTSSGNGRSFNPVISADGRLIAFESSASNLVATDYAMGLSDIFVRDLQTGTTTLVSVNQSGTNSGNGTSDFVPCFSADGRFVAIRQRASDLVAIATDGSINVFVRDLQTGTTTLASVNRAGTGGGNGQSVVPLLSADGRFVAFLSVASDLVATDTNGQQDVFMRDLHTGKTTLVSINQAGTGRRQ